MAFTIARRSPNILRRLAFGNRVPLIRRNVSFVSINLKRDVLSFGNAQFSRILPLCLTNTFATTAGRLAASKKTTAKAKESTKRKTTSTKKSKAKKIVVKKEPKPGRKPKPRTKEEEETEARRALKRRIKELKKLALQPPKLLPETSSALVFPGGRVKAGTTYYRNLPETEKERLREQAKANAEQNKINYERWVKSHSALEIYKANLARAQLRRLNYYPRRYANIKDDRQVPRPLGPFSHFMREAHATGELDGLTVAQTGTRLGEMWRSMTETEKNKYRQMHEEDVRRYEEEFRKQYPEDPRGRYSSTSSE
ncbi:hypothetical protein VTO42DRAFT_4147 [Malbranchea cinnamomea]